MRDDDSNINTSSVTFSNSGDSFLQTLVRPAAKGVVVFTIGAYGAVYVIPHDQHDQLPARLPEIETHVNTSALGVFSFMGKPSVTQQSTATAPLSGTSGHLG